jgi:hypothetical protein
VILGWILCGEAGRGRLLVIGVGVVDEPQSAVGKDFEADVAAHLGPFVVLFGEHGADQTDQSVPAGRGKMRRRRCVGEARLSGPWGLFHQIRRQTAVGKGVKARDVAWVPSTAQSHAGLGFRR